MARPSRAPTRHIRPFGLTLLLLAGSTGLAAAQSSSPGEGSPAAAEGDAPDDLDLRLELDLRLYAVQQKFRFRDGRADLPGSSIRTQEIGLDEPAVAPGARAAMWLDGEDALALELWTLAGDGEGEAPRALLFDGGRMAPRASLLTEYVMTYVAAEYVHRFRPLDRLWLDLGARVEYLDFRVSIAGVGRTALEAAWPTARVHVGVRPFDWLELEARLGGFELTLSLVDTHVEQPYEVGGLVRLRATPFAYLELGALMLHVHLEEDPGDPDEDALHLRQRAAFVAFGLEF